MGAWGSKIFEDDSTLEWLADFRDARSPLSMLQKAFSAVLQNDDYIEQEEGAAVFAAAEVVAAALGNPSDDYLKSSISVKDGSALSIEALKAAMSPDFVKMVVEALVKANDPERSEFAETWAESEDEERSYIVHDLLQRLSPA